MREGKPIALTPKAFETLVVLIERRGQLVEKGELMAILWPETAVEEANLTNNVWTLRKALDERQTGHRYIETVPKRGYRFIASVTEVTDAEDEVVVEKHTFTRIVTDEAENRESDVSGNVATRGTLAVAATVSAAPRQRVSTSHRIVVACLLLIGVAVVLYQPWASRGTKRNETIIPGRSTLKSIAVLPFKTIGVENNDSEYLGIGMSDALITRLGNSRRLIVRPTSAVRLYSNPQQDPLAAGREQGVEAVLDGTVQRTDERIRVTVQLFRAQDGALLWSAKFDELFTDIFTVQDSISERVMRELLVELNSEEQQHSGQRGSQNIQAYEAYLKGLYFWNKRNKDGYQKAVGYFNQAIERDPTYAPAYVGLGNAYAYLGGNDPGSQSEAIKNQRAAVKKALELDETLAEAHATRGLIAMNSDSNWMEADKEFKRAIELNPNYATAHQWYGEFLAWMGRFEEGIAESLRARELDPLSLIINTDLAKVYMISRRYDDAIKQFKRALEMDAEFEVARGLLALTYSLTGNHEAALLELRQIKHLESDPMYLSFLSYVYGEAGMSNEARQAVRRLSELSKRTFVSPLWMTVAYAGLGEQEQALKWFARIFEEQAQGTMTVKASPLWDKLRAAPQYASFMRRAGFSTG